MSDELQLHSLPVTRTAHFATLGKVGPHIRQLWIVTHGYGQLAKTFIRRFHAIMDDQTLVIAAEGLSRFYWGGFDGPVVASWMTKENRLDEIADYAKMLDQLYTKFVPQCHPEVEINLLGFSQGAATQVRWIMHSFPHFHRLMLWAGQLPEDLDYQPYIDYFADKQLFCAYGDQDPLVTPKRLQFMRKTVADSGLDFEEITYKGEHKVVKAALANWWHAIT